MTTVLVTMIGHQPLPSLLATRYLKPEKVIFLYSPSADVMRRKEHLAQLLPAGSGEIAIPRPIDPWDIGSIPQFLPDFLRRKKLDGMELLFDLTGGTKAMSIGLAESARLLTGVQLIYLESDRFETMLSRYHHDERGRLICDGSEQLPELLDLDSFFHAYLGKFDWSPQPNPQQSAESRQFEEDVAAGFDATRTLEIGRSVKSLGAEEIDIVLRRRNQFALVECKTGKGVIKIHGILQLSNLASERYLGTYTRKILVVQSDRSTNNFNNLEVARRHDVFVLQLPDWRHDRPRDGAGRMIWTDAEQQDFEAAAQFAFGAV